MNSKSPSLSIPSFHFSLQLALPTASNPFCSLPFCIPLYVFFLSRQSPTLSLFLRSRIWLFCFLSAFVYFMFFETPFLPPCRWLLPYNLYLLFRYCCILSPRFRTLGTHSLSSHCHARMRIFRRRYFCRQLVRTGVARNILIKTLNMLQKEAFGSITELSR